MKDAECRRSKVDPSVFFPERGQVVKAEIARFYCSLCPVLQECRDYMKRTGNKTGIWAGRFAYEAD